MPSRRTLVGAGIAALAVAGGLVARQVVAGGAGGGGRGGPSDAPARSDTEGIDVHRVETTDGATLRVLSRGEGTAILLVHGITLSADVWYHQLRDLPARGYRVVAMDLRGHGESTVGAGGLRLDRLAADVAEVIADLDLGATVLVGHSLGGMIALRTLARGAGPPRPGASEPQIVALGLVATSAVPVAARGLPAGRLLVRTAGPLLAGVARLATMLPGSSLPDSAVGDSLARVTFGREAPADEVARTRRFTARTPARVAVDLLAQIVVFDEEAMLSRVDVPTTVVVGTDDVLTPVGHAETLAARIPGARLVVVEGCGHMVMLEAPDALDQAIVDLAERCRTPGGSE